jgi:CRP-like cAMP-binding protein
MAEDVFKSRGMQTLERRLGQPLGVYLATRYQAGLSQGDIAAELGVNRATVSRWMTVFGIEVRYYGPRKAA